MMVKTERREFERDESNIHKVLSSTTLSGMYSATIIITCPVLPRLGLLRRMRQSNIHK